MRSAPQICRRQLPNSAMLLPCTEQSSATTRTTPGWRASGERFRNLFIEACGRLADLLSAAGEREEALFVLDRAIKTDPVCEDLVRRAMAIEAALGRRAVALARYRKLEATLDEQLGVEPDPETEALVHRMLRPTERAG